MSLAEWCLAGLVLLAFPMALLSCWSLCRASALDCEEDDDDAP